MDFLNKAIAQLSELFRSMTPGARITAGLLLAVVVISLGYLFNQGTAGPDAYLFGAEPLSDGELNRIEAALGASNLTWERENNRIRIPVGQQPAALAAISDAGALPPNFNTILENALDKGGPWESREATRERLKIAKQQTLTEIVRAHHWVEDAVVLIDEQQPRGLSGVKQVTGSVSVRPRIGESLDPRRAQMLKKLVAHAVVGMRAQDVIVTDLGDGGSVGTDGQMYPELIEDEYLRTKIAFEMQKRESILSALRDIPGVRVEVNAELDDTVESQTITRKPDAKPVVSHEVETTEKSTQVTGNGGGQPGVVAQGPTRQGATTTPEQNKNETTSSSEERTNLVGIDETNTLKKGYTPKEVWATVTVPSNYVETLWKQRNPTVTDPPKPEDMRLVHDEVILKVENIVEPLLLLQAIKGENTYKHVRVVVLDSLPVTPIEPPTTASQALAWTGRYWSTLAMLGVAMFSLLVLRSVVKGASSLSSSGAATPELTVHGDEPPAAADEETAKAELPRIRLKKAKSLKDDLLQIVHEDPDAAADILRTWISKAS